MVNIDVMRRKLLTELVFIVLLGVFAVLAAVLAGLGVWKPITESSAIWFQRSGAIVTVFCVVAQLRINGFLERIRGHANAESFVLFRAFEKHQSTVSWFVGVVAVLGAVIWGYGDLLFMHIVG